MIQNLVVEELSSIILLRADWASLVIRSASSNIIILKLGDGYFLWFKEMKSLLRIGILRNCGLGKFFDFFSNNTYTSIIRSIKF